MRLILAVALNDLRLLLAERGSFVARLLMPVAFIVVVGIANDAFQNGPVPVPVLTPVDRDGSELSGFYLRHVCERASGVVCAGPAAEFAGSSDDPRDALRADVADVAIVVPPGFGAALLAGGEPTVRLVFARGDPEQASRLVPLLEAAARQVSMVVQAGEAAAGLANVGYADEAARSAIARAGELLAEDRVIVAREAIELPARHELVGFRQSVPGMGSMFVMLSVLAGAAILVEERRRWTLQRTLIAPVSRAGFVLGKVAGRFVVGMIQYLVAVATAIVIGRMVGIDFGRSPLLAIAVMASFVLAMSATSIFLATLVAREQQASGLTTLLAVTLAPIGGAWWSLDMEIIPEIMRRIAVISPFYWVMEGFRAAIHDLGFVAAARPIAVLLGIAVVAGGLATVRMRRS